MRIRENKAMTVLDTDFLVALLKGNTDATELAERINFPKTTIINAFELYYGAKCSKKPEASLSKVISLLDSIGVLEFEKHAALLAAQIRLYRLSHFFE